MVRVIDAGLERRIALAVRAGMPHRLAARSFGVSRNTVQRIARGRRPRRKIPPQTTGPFEVPAFSCPTCRAVSTLKWNAADAGCFVCHMRAKVAQT